MLVRNITSKTDIPHEPGEWMVLRRLTGKQLRAARDKVGDNALDKMRKMGGDVFKAVNEINTAEAKVDDPKKKNPLGGYDVDVLLGFGIANWSYAVDGVVVPVNAETVSTLDDVTEKWAAEAVLRLSGALESGDDRKND